MTDRQHLHRVFRLVDDAMHAHDMDAIRDRLEAFPFRQVRLDGLDEAVMLLMACKPVRHQLLATRGHAIGQLGERLREIAPDRADAILRHL